HQALEARSAPARERKILEYCGALVLRLALEAEVEVRASRARRAHVARVSDATQDLASAHALASLGRHGVGVAVDDRGAAGGLQFDLQAVPAAAADICDPAVLGGE